MVLPTPVKPMLKLDGCENVLLIRTHPSRRFSASPQPDTCRYNISGVTKQYYRHNVMSVLENSIQLSPSVIA